MNQPQKPYSESCDQNRDPILEIIKPVLANSSSILEIGSGTGQHAVYFARNMPHLQWHTSDRREYHQGINIWLQEAALPNTHEPLELDVTHSNWPKLAVDAVFSANTCHIMHWPDVVAMFKGVGMLLPENGHFLVYGPFNYDGKYTSESNERFDEWLKSRDPLSGVRDFSELNKLAIANNLALVKDYSMPANNRILHWHKQN